MPDTILPGGPQYRQIIVYQDRFLRNEIKFLSQFYPEITFFFWGAQIMGTVYFMKISVDPGFFHLQVDQFLMAICHHHYLLTGSAQEIQELLGIWPHLDQ